MSRVKDQHEENQLAVGYTSVSIANAIFIGILAYHIFQQLRHTKLWKKVPKLNTKQAVNILLMIPQNLQTLISFMNPGLKNCYHPPTVASELCIPVFVFFANMMCIIC